MIFIEALLIKPNKEAMCVQVTFGALKWIMVTFILLLSCVNTSSAQYITDKSQELKWFGLQHLAEEQALLAKCLSFEFSIALAGDPVAKEAFWKKFHSNDNDVANAIEEYVAQYGQTRGAGETIAAFRFRVWSVTLDVGGRAAEKKFSRANCTAFLQQNAGPASH